MTEIMKRIYDKEWKEFLKYKEAHPERPLFNSIEKERAYFNLLGNYGFMTPKEYHITMMETLEGLTPYDFEELAEYLNEYMKDCFDPEYHDEDEMNVESALQCFIATALEEDL